MKRLLTAILFIVCVAAYAQQFYEQSGNLAITGSYGANAFGLGGGLSFADFNNDGYDDLTFCTSSGNQVLFYENKISHFELLFPGFINNTNESKHAVWIDFDNDGDKDLFVSSFLAPNLLYENNGSFIFTDVTSSKGLPITNNRTYGVNFFDYNLDGYLDIYVCNFNFSFESTENELYIYNLQQDKYIDFSATYNSGNGSKPTFCSTAFDYNFDQYPDLYIANDRPYVSNALLQNNNNLGFTDLSASTNSDLYIFAMNTCVADYNNDGYWDIYITNEDNFSSSLLEGNSSFTFTDVSVSTNTELMQLGWTGNFFDLDNDRDEDLYISCTSFKNNKTNSLYENNNFIYSEPLLNNLGLNSNDTVPGFTNAIGDFNNDGLPDIALNNYPGEDFTFYLNAQNELSNNNFIKLKLEGTNSNRDAIGAVVKVWQNGTYRIFQKHCSNGFLNQNSDYLNIGCGNDLVVDSLVIEWPYLNSTDKITIGQIPAKALYYIKEGTGLVSLTSLSLCKTFHDIKIDPIVSQTYGSSTLTKASSVINANSEVILSSDTEVLLDLNFDCKAGADLFMTIQNCY